MRPLLVFTLFTLGCDQKPDDDDSGEAASAVWAAPACPALESTEVTGYVNDKRITEASGLVASHTYDGVLWTHNDSGDGQRIYALDESGATLNGWDVGDGQADDLEDIAIGQMSDRWWLFVADFGDNTAVRDHVVVTATDEPDPSDPDPAVSMYRRMQWIYPDGPHDAETLLFDPLTEDLLVVTKDLSGPVGVYRKPAPHWTDTTTTLERVAEIDFSTSPLGGQFPTGGDVHVSGAWVALRNYSNDVWVWPRDPSLPLWQAFSNAPCPYTVPQEPQGESIAFGPNDLSLWTLSEGTSQPLYHTALTPAP